VTGPGIGPLGIIWLIAGVLPILQRRAFPLAAFVLSAALVISYYSSGYQAGPSAIVPVFLLVSLAYHRGPLVAGAAAAAVCVGIGVLVAVRHPSGLVDPSTFGVLVLALAAVAIGNRGTHPTLRAARGQGARRSGRPAARRGGETARRGRTAEHRA